MSERLTLEWTETLEEAFGSNGAWGREGELWLIKVLSEKWGWFVEDFGESKEKQLQGHDISIRNPKWKNSYTVDVKNNIRKNGSFDIDTSPTGWLFNETKTSHRIWHVNSRLGLMCWYDRRLMKKFLKENDYFDKGQINSSLIENIDSMITKRKASVSL